MSVESIRIYFESCPEVDFQGIVRAGAIILDVRSYEEFTLGHIHGSVNVPLEDLYSLPYTPSEGNVFITCCATGMKSAVATKILKSSGFPTVFNGGSWTSLEKILTEEGSVLEYH